MGQKATMMDTGVKRAIEAAGSMSELARRLGLSRQAIMQWEKVPDKYLLKIEKLTGVDRTQLRPDLYRRCGTGDKVRQGN